MGKREWQDGQIRAECVLRPAAVVILATSACFWKSVGRNANECVLPRAVPVVEAMALIGLMELWKERAACVR